MKIFIYVVFVVVFTAVAYQIYTVDSDRRDFKRDMAKIVDEVDLIESDNAKLHNQIDYFSEPRNLEKELRARFNYRLPNEKLIIVIPNSSSTGD
jgi:hypothetical protein